jgi:hypothetical protein
MINNADLISVTRGSGNAPTGLSSRRCTLGKVPTVPLNISNQKAHANVGHVVVPFLQGDDSDMLLPADSITIKPDTGAQRTYLIDSVVVYGAGSSLGHWLVSVTDEPLLQMARLNTL